ncbi:class F sortase [Streptomyces sp. RKND-216]|nr:class F sortase [Streptomyces sp. RKND-216]THA27950.1 class F sortase [Streptomyces sp. RKND-216]
MVLAAAPQQAPSDFGRAPTAGHDGRHGGAAASGSRRPGVPVRLRLPNQHVRADVVPVGVTSAGDLAVPGDADDVGWYRPGARPGSRHGSAVLVGHVDSRSGELGALAALATVRRGDPLLVRQDDGTHTRYRITARRTVNKTALSDRVFRTTGPPVLTLITCTGPFQPEDGGYQQLLLVTATPAGPRAKG